MPEGKQCTIEKISRNKKSSQSSRSSKSSQEHEDIRINILENKLELEKQIWKHKKKNPSLNTKAGHKN